MFKIVNPDLVNIKEVIQGNDKIFYIESMDIEKRVDNKEFKKYRRDIMNFKISDAGDFMLESSCDLPTKFKLYDDEKGTPKFTMTVLKNSDRDYTNTYLLAIPFNGVIKPIELDPKYRIYKGLMVTSRSGFSCNFSKYFKCLYLLVEPNLKLFNPEHKYHCDEIVINIDTYDHSKYGYTHATTTIRFEENGAVQYSEFVGETHKDQPNDWYIPHQDGENKKPIWQTFKFEKKEDREAREHNTSLNDNKDTDKSNLPFKSPAFSMKNDDTRIDYNDKPNRKKQKRGGGKKSSRGYRSGDYYITTNKNGIRQEIPIRNTKHKIDKYNYEEEY